ncbi:hypothetical protein PITC_041430 [Penicillium italicum]|uniref:Uncharacterized protein n=1 Tax=Penicillium italicum TaxID=40296 RepID=A0A0A2LDB1_PENIT|nr:hypothetical protein PITC_041430 [Penicillium italicum]
MRLEILLRGNSRGHALNEGKSNCMDTTRQGLQMGLLLFRTLPPFSYCDSGVREIRTI